MVRQGSGWRAGLPPQGQGRLAVACVTQTAKPGTHPFSLGLSHGSCGLVFSVFAHSRSIISPASMAGSPVSTVDLVGIFLIFCRD